MKRFISALLCVVMVISVFASMGVSTFAATTASSLMSVTNAGYVNDKITYTVYLAAGVNITAANIHIQFDPEVLTPSKVSESGCNGYFESGVKYDNSSSFSVGYFNTMGYSTGDSKQKFFSVTFTVKDATHPKTDVSFYCDEFENTSYTQINSSQLFYEDLNHLTLSEPQVKLAINIGYINVSWAKITGASKYYVYRKAGSETGWTRIATVTSISYKDTNVTSLTKYKYTVRAVNSYGAGEYISGVTMVYVNTPVIASLKNTSTGITAAWNSVNKATSYRLYRRTVNSNGTYSSWSLVSSTTKTTAADTKASAGVRYQYVVRAYVSGGQSALSKGVDVTRLTIPSVSSLSNSYTGITVKWNAVAGAESYRVYRKLKGASSWTTVTTVKSSVRSFNDTGVSSGKTYYYTVAALATGSKSAYTSKSIVCVSSPKVSSIYNSTTGVTIKWGKIAGATKYVVYRKAGNASSWTNMTTVTGTSFVDKNVKSGVTYKYTLRAVNDKTNSSYNGTGWSIKFLSSPALSSVKSAKAGITFTYKSVSGASGYNIYRKTGTGSYSRIAIVTGGSVLSYRDVSVKKGTTYTYTVRAFSGNVLSAYRTGLSCKSLY